MLLSRSARLLVALALSAGAALAADEGGRYTMTPTDDGVVRLDTRSGAMALCRRTGDQWACEDMDDSQRRLLSEIEKLRSENDILKAQVEHLEATLGLGEGQENAPQAGAPLKLPTEEEVDKAFDYLETMLRKLRDRLEKLEKEHGRDPAL
jgi:BMFP domain-containing protein YqiC